MCKWGNISKLAAITVILLTLGSFALANKIIYADDDGPADFNNIQAAIDDANDGDTILIADGVYIIQDTLILLEDNLYYLIRNPISIEKSITVKSELGPENCVIECQLPQVPLAFFSPYPLIVSVSGEGKNSILEGLTIKGNHGGECSGIICRDCNSCTIKNCIIKENQGTGIDGYDCNSFIITNCTISQSGGIRVSNHHTCIIRNCIIKENPRGLYIYSYVYSSNTLIENCIITGNKVPESEGNMYNLYYGGGIYLNGTDNHNMVLKNCVISGNKADLGAGVANQSGIPRIENCIITDNISYKKKGNQIYSGNAGASCPNGAYCHCSMTLEYCCFENDPNALYEQGWGRLYTNNCISADPCFVDPGYWDANDTPDDPNDDFWVQGDYHLKSQAGRYDPNTQSWIQDDVISPCIDAGDPNSPIGLEPFPNGGRINIGAYGGTAEASKSYFGKPPCETIIAGDINGDCKVDETDLAILMHHWLEDHNP